MRLDWKNLSMRGERDGTAYETPVVDVDTGKKVRFVRFEVTPVFRLVSLFDDKYQGQFKSNEECDAFIRGVEAVLNHMTSIGIQHSEEPRRKSSAIAAEDLNASNDE